MLKYIANQNRSPLAEHLTLPPIVCIERTAVFTALQTTQWFGLSIPLVSALIGGLLALLGSALFNWNQRRIEQKRLRRILAMEMGGLYIAVQAFYDNESEKFGGALDRVDSPTRSAYHEYDDTETNIYSSRQTMLLEHDNLRHPQYDNVQNDLRLLSRYEIKVVMEFYEWNDLLKTILDKYDDPPASSENLYSRNAILAYQRIHPYLTGNVVYRWKHRQKRRWKRWTTQGIA